MKRILTAAAIALLAIGSISARSSKRGVCHKQFNSLQSIEVLQPGVEWYYSWGTVPPEGSPYYDYTGVQFVPMTWGLMREAAAEAIRKYVQSNPNCKYLLGYNEPNFKSQSNITPEDAAANWPEVKALADELGLQLVAPALNYSPDTDPFEWMDRFIAIVGNDAFNFTAVHAYGGTGVTQRIATDFHDRYGKPVWLTEFAYWPGESGYVAPDRQIEYMQEIVGWLETTPWIHSYAWFMNTGVNNSSSPNYALVENQYDAATDQINYALTRQGRFYVGLPGNDGTTCIAQNQWLAPNEAAYAYEDLEWELADDNATSTRLYVSRFKAKGHLDFRIEAPQADKYNLAIRVGGFGEPTKFDPQLGVALIDPATGEVTSTLAEPVTFSLPNSDTQTDVVIFSFDLPAGKNCVRLYSSAAFASGMTIHEAIVATAASLETLETSDPEANDYPTEYFNLQGLKIQQPTQGIFLRRQGSQIEKIVL